MNDNDNIEVMTGLKTSRRANSWWMWLFAIVMTAGMTGIMSFNIVLESGLLLESGQPAPENIFAPHTLNFASDILTTAAKEKAAADVQDIYSPEDPNIGRNQLNQANLMFTYIETVRADVKTDIETRIGYLTAIETAVIDEETASDLLTMNEVQYNRAKTSSLTIIDNIMRQTIRETELDKYKLDALRQVSLALTNQQSNVVSTITPQFISPNSFPNADATTEQRETAVDAVEPVFRSVTQGERIVEGGEKVDDLDIEMMDALGMLQTETNWYSVLSIFLLSLLVSILIVLYWQRYEVGLRNNLRYLLLLGFLLLLSLASARIMLSNSPQLLYWFPITTFSLLTAVVFEVRFSILLTAVLSIMIGYMQAATSFEITIYLFVGGAFAILTLQDVYAQRINPFFRAGAFAAIGHIVALLLFALPQDAELVNILKSISYAMGNGALSAVLTLLGLYTMGVLFGVTTTIQLQDLSRLDHPLLRQILRQAPGTYHHSIMVANLAEQAAERIGVNSTLVRVGAFYHDVGKMKRPLYFTENQQGVNPHDTMDPYDSARIIISHVTDGLELAAQYKLPDRIRHFIAEHHGQRLVMGFYKKAQAQAGDDADNVDKERFRYLGPRPRSPESAIVLMADAIDATSTALRPSTAKEIEKLVNSIVDSDLIECQLNDSGLTMGDIQEIRNSFIDTLKGRFHVRVKYPGNDEMMSSEDEHQRD